MVKTVWNRFTTSRFVRYMLNTLAPRWLVFAVDLSIVVLSCLLIFTFNTLPDFNPDAAWYLNMWLRTAVVAAVYAISSLALRTYAYIIRLSMIVDLYRLMIMVTLSSVTMAVITLLMDNYTGLLFMRLWNIFLIGMLSFTMMMCMRLALKYLYNVLTHDYASREKVFVLGSALNSVLVANALNEEKDGHYRPVALLGLTGKSKKRSMNELPVIAYNPDDIKAMFNHYDCSTLIFLSSQYEFVKAQLADTLLTNGIKLMMLNQIEELDMNGDNSPNLSPHVHKINIEDLLGRDTISTDQTYVSRAIANQTVMITGAAGSIGSEIVRQVAKYRAKDIVLVDQAESPMHDMQLELNEHFPDVRIHLFIGDVTNRTRMERAFVKYHPRYVFHAAAYKHVPMMERNPTEAILTNVIGTKNVADLSEKYGVEKFVMISTDKAVNPTNIMGASKRIAEIYVQSLFFYRRATSDNATTKFITTRFGNVLGSNGSVIPLFRKQIENGGPVTLTHRNIIRYFMTIPEACSLVLEAGCMGNGGEIYIFDMGKPVKIYDLACRMISLAGLRPHIDIKIVETGLRPGEKLYEELLNDKEKTIATHHQKIMIAKVRVYDYPNVIKHIDNLVDAINHCDTHRLVNEMKHIVPEYHSQNSEWEAVDREIQAEEHHDNVIEVSQTTINK